MCETDQATDRPPAPAPPSSSRTEYAVEITQTVLTGLILAFIFRAFLVEPFIIPTGSMADSLLGTHATRVCPACGWEYSFAPMHSSSPTETGFVRPNEIICPNCQLRLIPTDADTTPRAGDRVLVHKWPYALGLLGPSRWDVIVFRDPANAQLYYIKRLVGLPNETVEIVAGDLFINGRIARKPAYAQDVLWFVVFDQAHVADANATSGRWARWIARDRPDTETAAWHGMDTRVISYDGLDETTREIAFNPDAGREYLLDLYAYDRWSSGRFVGDVRLVSELTLRAGDGWCRWELDRSPLRFFARLERGGTVQLGMQSDDEPGEEKVIGTYRHKPFDLDRPIAVEFGHVDYRVYVKIDGQQVLTSTDADYSPNLAELRDQRVNRPVGLQVAARNLQLELRGLRIDRDVYYTQSNYSRRAQAGNPFTLQAEECFVLGDNSPDSHDSREWTEVGPHMPPDCRPGTVRADQIVGRAAFVYLPGLLPLDASGRWLVPDLGRVRFIR